MKKVTRPPRTNSSSENEGEEERLVNRKRVGSTLICMQSSKKSVTNSDFFSLSRNGSVATRDVGKEVGGGDPVLPPMASPYLKKVKMTSRTSSRCSGDEIDDASSQKSMLSVKNATLLSYTADDLAAGDLLLQFQIQAEQNSQRNSLAASPVQTFSSSNSSLGETEVEAEAEAKYDQEDEVTSPTSASNVLSTNDKSAIRHQHRANVQTEVGFIGTDGSGSVCKEE